MDSSASTLIPLLKYFEFSFGKASVVALSKVPFNHSSWLTYINYVML